MKNNPVCPVCKTEMVVTLFQGMYDYENFYFWECCCSSDMMKSLSERPLMGRTPDELN